jgi:TRAP-type C4-dicarboxylate transport system permease small subunit
MQLLGPILFLIYTYIGVILAAMFLLDEYGGENISLRSLLSGTYLVIFAGPFLLFFMAISDLVNWIFNKQIYIPKQ